LSLEILIIRLSALGDVVHTLPVAAAIKRYVPDAKVTWLVQSLAAPLLKDNPAVDNLVIFPGKSVLPGSVASPPVVNSIFKRCLGFLRRLNARQDARLADGSSPTLAHSNSLSSLKLMHQFWQEFKSRKYDIAIDAQGLLKSGFLCWLSGAKKRIGFANTREWADKFLTHPVDVGDYFGHDIHIIDLNLKLIIKLFDVLGSNVPTTWLNAQFPLPAVPEDTKERVQSWLTTSGQPKERLNIILIPGTTWDTKIWPLEQWEELGRLLLENNNCQLIVCGGKAEITTNKKLEKHLLASGRQNIINLTGKTNLLDLIALFEQAQIVIGADSGPMHLACAVGKSKVIGIYGATPWKRNGPYGKNGHAIALNLDCQPCFEKKCPLHTLACLKDLSAEKVEQEINAFVYK